MTVKMTNSVIPLLYKNVM